MTDSLQEHTDEVLPISELRDPRSFEIEKDGILLVEFETGKILDANPFLCVLLGYTAAELIGRKLWEIAALHHIAASRTAFLELQNKECIRYEHVPLETANGRHIDVEFVSNVPQEQKNIIRCNIRDITVRKREAAREQSLSGTGEERFRSLLESVDGTIVLDGEGIVRLVNSRIERLFGYPRKKLLGRMVETLMPERFHSRYRTQRARYLINEKARRTGMGLHICGLRSDDTEFPIDVDLSPLRTENATLVLATVRVTSEPKQLKTMHSQLSAIAESTEYAMVSQSLDRVITG
jgi:PAS domain S-box-containing protein